MPTTPEKTAIAAPQQKPVGDADVMQAVKRRGVPIQSKSIEQAKERLRRIIVQMKVNPQEIIQAGNYASMALKNKSLYPMAMQIAVKDGLVKQEDIKPGVIDYPLLAKAITAGKMTQQLIQEGKL